MSLLHSFLLPLQPPPQFPDLPFICIPPLRTHKSEGEGSGRHNELFGPRTLFRAEVAGKEREGPGGGGNYGGRGVCLRVKREEVLQGRVLKVILHTDV